MTLVVRQWNLSQCVGFDLPGRFAQSGRGSRVGNEGCCRRIAHRTTRDGELHGIAVVVVVPSGIPRHKGERSSLHNPEGLLSLLCTLCGRPAITGDAVPDSRWVAIAAPGWYPQKHDSPP